MSATFDYFVIQMGKDPCGELAFAARHVARMCAEGLGDPSRTIWKVIRKRGCTEVFARLVMP